MTTTVQQRNGFGSRLFSRGKEFGPVWPLFLRSRKGATRTVRAAAAQAACDPRGRSFFGLVATSCGARETSRKRTARLQRVATSGSDFRQSGQNLRGFPSKKKKNLRGFRSRSYTKAMAWCYSGRHLSSNHFFFFGPLVPREILSVQTGQE